MSCVVVGSDDGGVVSRKAVSMVKRVVIEERRGVTICFNDLKNYWKPHVTLDVVLAYHEEFSCLELVAYYPEANLEAPRLYLAIKPILNQIDAADIEWRVAEKKEHLLRIKHRCEEESVVKEVTLGLVSAYVLSRLAFEQRANDGEGDNKMSLHVFLAPTECDGIGEEPTSCLIDPVLRAKPTKLDPLVVVFPKKSHYSKSEVAAAMHNVQVEAAQARQATHLASLAISSVDGFRVFLAHRLQWKNYSPARILWIKAINRVLSQNYVAKVRARLEVLERRQKAREQRRSAGDALPCANKASKPPRILRRSFDGLCLPPIRPDLRRLKTSTTAGLGAEDGFVEGKEQKSAKEATATILKPNGEALLLEEKKMLHQLSKEKSRRKSLSLLHASSSLSHQTVLSEGCAEANSPPGGTAGVPPSIRRNSLMMSTNSLVAARPSLSSHSSMSPLKTEDDCDSPPSLIDSFVSKSSVSTTLLPSHPLYLPSDALARTLNCHL